MNNTFKKHVFTPLEKKVFLEILKKYLSIIENKNTDAVTLRRKSEAWDDVAHEYNSNPHPTNQATSRQLKRLWMNLKQRRRDALRKERQHRMTNGDEPSARHIEIDVDVSEIEGAIDDTLYASEITPDIIVNPEEIYKSSAPIPAAPYVSGTTSTPSPPSPPPLQSRPPPVAPTRPTAPNSVPIIQLPNPTLQRKRNAIWSKEYKDKKRRAEQIHAEEMDLMLLRKREATAKADLAELLLQREQAELDLLKEKVREAKAKADLAELHLHVKRE